MCASAALRLAYVAFLDTCKDDQYGATNVARQAVHLPGAVDTRYLVFAKLRQWEHTEQQKNMLGTDDNGLDMSE